MKRNMEVTALHSEAENVILLFYYDIALLIARL